MKNEISIILFAIPVLTYDFKKRYIYRLSDMAYNEWVILEDDKPRYYLNLFDNIYKDINEYLETNRDRDVSALLEQSFRDNNLNLSLSETFQWMISFESKEKKEEFKLEKYPPDFFNSVIEG